MNFKQFFNENNKELAKTYTDILSNIPQDPVHHPEGFVDVHVKLVRKSINKAIELIKSLKEQNPQVRDILSNIDFNVSQEERNILYMAAWLHDIGKTTATTIDNVPFRQATGTGKIRSLGHEDPEHYGPQIDKLKTVASPAINQFYDKHKDIINFMIERHMDFSQGGFSRLFLDANFDNGKLKNDIKLKLLLILMWADKLGRTPEKASVEGNISKLIEASEKSKIRTKNMIKKPQFEGTPEEFKNMLKSKGLSDDAINKALFSKFPHLNTEGKVN